MKGNINNFFQMFVMIFTMAEGFFFVYTTAWLALDLRMTAWAIAVLYALAFLSVIGYIKWIQED